MFKKRTINSKPIANTQIDEQVIADNRDQQQVKLNQKNKNKINELSQHEKIKQSDKMQEKSIENQDQQFLQKLKRDKKLNDLFANLEAEEKQNQNREKQKQTSKSNQQFLKSNFQPLKVASYVKKRINFTFTQSEQTPKDVSEFKININPLKKSIKPKQQKKQTEIEMQDIFRQIRQQNKKQEQTQLERLQQQKELKQPVSVPQPTIKANQFIIQDEDGFVEEISKQQFALPTISLEQHGSLQVAVDYEGNLSPQLSQHEDEMEDLHHEDDYEDELIRKTLTRNNYLKLQQKSNLKQTKISHKKQKLFNTILKTSWNDIENKLTSDINQKLTKKNQLIQEMKYLEERVTERSSQIDKKKQVLKQLQHQQKRLKKVIYFLCYFGDQVCGKNQSIESFFGDLTSNIIDKIEKISDKINIEEFMEKKRSRQEFRQEYQKGRKKIKGNQKNGTQQQINEQENEQDDEDGQFFMQEDDF